MAAKPKKQGPKARASSGAQSVSVYLLPEERALWDRLAPERGMSKKDAFVAGLRALEDGEITADDVIAWVRAHG